MGCLFLVYAVNGISFAIHLRANRAGFASENNVIVAEINDLCAMSLAS